jgi:hypothetical protein
MSQTIAWTSRVKVHVHPQKRILLALNVVGGVAVLGSYYAGFATHPESADALWGGVPEGLKSFYTVSMLLAAAGYFPFTAFLLFCVDADRARILGRFGFAWFNLLYALILIPSALWMPLTFSLIDTWSPGLWVAIRVVLALVGIGSLGLLAALITLTPARPRALRLLAIAGAVAFCVQTALLDATVWPAYFPIP